MTGIIIHPKKKSRVDFCNPTTSFVIFMAYEIRDEKKEKEHKMNKHLP